MLHDWPYQEDTLTADGFVVLPPQTPSEPPPARALRQRTHCPAGHSFTVDNTLLTWTGRRCLACLAQVRELPPEAQRAIATGRRWAELPRRGAA